jgi:DNA primase
MIDKLLERLEGVRRCGTGRWMAKCPAHEDRRPSLSIGETADGRVLIHCFGGCDSEAIVKAIGLTMSDLFPTPIKSTAREGGFESRALRVAAEQALYAVEHEILVATLILSDCLETGRVDAAQVDRLAQAGGRLTAALDVAGRCARAAERVRSWGRSRVH